MNKIEINTRDGICPAVLVYMDGPGIRPAVLEVGERLATYGYFVLLPDLFYRGGPYEPMNPHTLFSDPEQRKMLMEKFFARATQPDVQPGKIGTTGYCRGGLMSLTAAGTYPDRILGTASYHGGRLATDSPERPHLLAPKMKSRVYIGGAIEDASFPDGMKARLEAALTHAGVDHQIETYRAKHGWVLRDTPAYDAAAAERHWQTLTALLEASLKE